MSDEAGTSTTKMRVRFCETDLMGVVHHANYLLYCEAARVDWLRKRGGAYESWVERGIHLPVAESKVRYKKPARFDDLLEVATTVAKLSRASVLIRYRISRGGELVCEAETLLACVDDDLRLRRIPPEVTAVFRSPEIDQKLAEAVE